MKNLVLRTLILALYAIITDSKPLGDLRLNIQKKHLIILPIMQLPRKINIIELKKSADEESSFSSGFQIKSDNRFQSSLFFRKKEFFKTKPINNNINEMVNDKTKSKIKSSNIKSNQFDFDEKFENFFGKSTSSTTQNSPELSDGEFMSSRINNENFETTSSTNVEPFEQAHINNNNNNFIVNEKHKTNSNFNNNNILFNEKLKNIINNNNNNNLNTGSGVNVNFNNNNIGGEEKDSRVSSINNNNNNLLVDGEKANNVNFNNNNLVRFGVKDQKVFGSKNLTSILNKQSRRTINININNNNGFPEKRDSFSSSDSFINNNNNNIVITGSNSGSLNLHNDNRIPKNNTETESFFSSNNKNQNNPLSSKIISGIKYVFQNLIGSKVKRKIFGGQLEDINKSETIHQLNNLVVKKSLNLPRF